MIRVLAISLVALMLAGCGSSREMRTATGAMIGAGGGAIAGNAIGGTTGAWVGGLGGAATGAIIGSRR
ncbi:glycine zipper 2TM domain-containing protein [Mesorhizobium xinjiangense]|uniref:glycine zipper 2TM domain-containing protein n=1 Tax=Mesorhizobium xinjiangense TaxID=2678685 RepID=UPI0012EDE3E7|nr:glycine zipper 2TM domain-containing protein [Mesorhizobium xinjiangense]